MNFIMSLSLYQNTTEDKAWDLVSSCIKRVFEDLRQVREPGANVSADPPISHCTMYLWALIQSHRIMKEYLDSRFMNHPSIAPVIILHVFRIWVTKVQFEYELKRKFLWTLFQNMVLQREELHV
jgi:hypothetical protein